MLGDSVRRRRRTTRSADRAEQAEYGPSGQRRIWPWVIAALLLPFAVGYAVAALVLFPPRAEAEGLPGGVPVPELAGGTAGDAERELAELGLTLLEATELPHPEAEPGAIIAQDPLPGQHLRPGAGVRVAVSSGPPRARIPDVAGFPLERARELLQRLGFEVASVERPSETPTGRVIGIAPEPGSEHRLPATVTVVVSIGQPVTDDPTVVDTAGPDPSAVPLIEPADTTMPAPPPDASESADPENASPRNDAPPAGAVAPPVVGAGMR